jgi:hypothetical protein
MLHQVMFKGPYLLLKEIVNCVDFNDKINIISFAKIPLLIVVSEVVKLNEIQ